jgi:hypothetical protein
MKNPKIPAQKNADTFTSKVNQNIPLPNPKGSPSPIIQGMLNRLSAK